MPSPAVEPRARGAGIDPGCRGRTRGVVAGIEEDVSQGVADLFGALQGPGVEALGEHRAASSPGAVQAAGQADAQRADAAGEGGAVLGLDQEVQVVGLDAEVDQAAPVSGLGRSQDTLQQSEEARRAQVGQPGPESQRHVGGVVVGEGGSSAVGGPGPRPFRLSSGA